MMVVMPISGWHLFDAYNEKARYAVVWLLGQIQDGHLGPESVVHYTVVNGSPVIFVDAKPHVIVEGIGGLEWGMAPQ